jgi:glycerol-3-phosphate O-acyltransferase/dihydroxyacetone phosphate acyltransferase
MISFTSKLKAYNGSLKALGLKDHQLLSTERGNNYFPVAFLLVRLCSRLSKLILLTTLTLPGLILFAPIFIFTSRMSRKKTAEALANSSVKIKAHDVVATWKILIALILTPLFYNFYAFLLVILHKYNIISNFLPATSSTKAIIALSWIILPFITYASLVFGEQGMDILKSLHPLLLSLDPRSQKVTEKLSRERHDLVRRIKEIVDRYGPDIFPDCEDILVWKERGPKKLYADISPEMEMSELLELNDFL